MRRSPALIMCILHIMAGTVVTVIVIATSMMGAVLTAIMAMMVTIVMLVTMNHRRCNCIVHRQHAQPQRHTQNETGK